MGMSGRGAQSEDFTSQPGALAGTGGARREQGIVDPAQLARVRKAVRRSIQHLPCDRFVVPYLTTDQQRDIGRGTLLLDQLTRSFIRAQLGYRFPVCRDGAEALAVEHDIRAGSLPAGPPYLNPL